MPPQPPASEQDATRLKLLEAAIELFAQHGYDGTNVRQICDLAQVKNIGAINYHFQGKDNLYRQAVQHALGKEGLEEMAKHIPASLKPKAKLKAFIHGMLHHHLAARNPHGIRLLMREFASPSEACVEAVERNIRPMSDLLDSIVAEFLPNSDKQSRMLCSLSIIGQCLYYVQNLAIGEILFGKEAMHELSVEILAGHIYEFSLAGLTKKGKSQ
jgi:TetR/AcrR family transcriptional regulator, regulator of cefoperazone and chloramphenicol sensitivity